MSKIKYSVGKNGMNRKIDSAFIQSLLNIKLKNSVHFKNLDIDGICLKKTIDAITLYQRDILRFAHPDGLIEPNRSTFNSLINGIPPKELTATWNNVVIKFNHNKIITKIVPSTASPLPENIIPSTEALAATGSENYSFPLDFIPTASYHLGGHARYFGARRSGGNRLHAGCDLLAPVGSPVYAMADGIVRDTQSYFYESTYSIEIQHGSKVVRYGELLASAANSSHLGFLAHLKKGVFVKKGAVIGYVGQLNSGNSMLHLEIYSGAESGPLTQRRSSSQYKRRTDLLNPTRILDNAKKSLPKDGQVLEQNEIKNAIQFGKEIYRKRGF